MENRILGTGTFISLGCPAVTEIVAGMGFDWMLLDMEHGLVTMSNLMQNMYAASASATKVIVRVEQASAPLIGHVLDYGADGIMVPHVSSASEASAIVRMMSYPPYGDRGLSTSTRCFGYGKKTPGENPAPLFIAQIEDYDAVVNSDSIAGVDGVDMLFIGPRDLGHDLASRPAGSTMDFDDAVRMVACSALRHGKQAGILVRNPEDIGKLRSYGYTALAAGSDMAALRNGYKDMLDSFR